MARLGAAVRALEERRAADDARLTAQERALARLGEALATEAAARRRAEAEAERRGGAFKLGGLSVQLGGYVQADGILHHQASQDELNPATGAPLNQTRFLIRRARLRLDADYRILGAAFELDGNTVQGPSARIFAAEVSIRWPARARGVVPYLMAAIGLVRIPFGFEVPQLESQRFFLERTNASQALFPGLLDLGIRVSGGWRALRYAVALMNGEPAGGTSAFAGLDPNAGKDLLGRLGLEARLGGRVTVVGGGSALYGKGLRPGTAATKDVLVWRDANLDGQVDPTELQGVLGRPATPSQGFDRYALGGDLRLAVELPRVGALTLEGEVIWATNLDRGLVPADPVGAGRDLRELGWHVALTQTLTRWAAVGVRYDRYDPDADATARIGATVVPLDRTFSTWAVAVAASYPPWARLTLEYDRNSNALGRTASGAPATRGSDVVTLRAQVVY